MSDDPITDLRAQLLSAAQRQQAPHTTPSPSPVRPRWRRRPFLVAITVLLVAAPAAAAISGVLDLGSGTTPDGGTFRVTTTSDDRSSGDPTTTDGRGRTCQQTEFRKAGELVARVTGCAPAGTETTQPLAASVIVAPGDSRLVTATVSDDVARVGIAGVNDPIELRSIQGEPRRFLQAITTVSPVTVIAYDRDGHELQRVALGF